MRDPDGNNSEAVHHTFTGAGSVPVPNGAPIRLGALNLPLRQHLCEHCPSFRTDAASLAVLAVQCVYTEALLADAQHRGWVDEADRHRRLLDRFDTLIAQTGTR